MSNTKNNFDMLRLFAAFQVAFSHSSAHLEHSISFLWFLSLFPGVPIFFFLSGYLIYGSYQSSSKNRNQILNFYSKRFLRLFPGLWICLLLSCILVWVSGYLNNVLINYKDAFFWFAAQSTFFQFYNPEFLRGFGVGALNGALWTISVEIQFYLLVPIVFRLMHQNKLVIFAIIFLFIILNVLNSYFNSGHNIFLKLINVSFAPWFYMFLIGAFFAKFKEYLLLVLRTNIFFLFLAMIIIYFTSKYLSLSWGNQINPFGFALIIAIVIHLAFTYPGLSDRILRKNDISYGIYIYHMPIINYILYIYGPGVNQFFVAIVGTFAIASFSWFLIERPSLRFKKNALRMN